MERKRKKINIKFIVLILSLIVFLCISVLTYAWFTDSKSYTGTLNFGELKLKVSGDSVTDNSKTLSFDTARKLNNDSTWTGKFMPGDTINIKLKVGLEDGSEPAYYIVHITDDKNVFENAFYYSQDGTNVYVNDGKKIYKQGTTTSVSSPIIGKISAGDSNAHSLTISAKISEDFTQQGVKSNVVCNIFAIQRANLEEKTALGELLINSQSSEDKRLYTQVNYLESNGTQYFTTDFYIDKTKDWTMEYSVKWNNTTARQLIGFNTSGSGWWGVNEGYYQATGTKKASVSVNNTTFDNIKLVSASGSINFYVNDTLTFVMTIGDSTGHLKLFAAYDDGSTSYYWNYCQMKALSIKQGGVLVHNFIPAIRNSDNKPGMLDTVCGRFYTNQGSGEFSYA